MTKSECYTVMRQYRKRILELEKQVAELKKSLASEADRQRKRDVGGWDW